MLAGRGMWSGHAEPHHSSVTLCTPSGCFIREVASATWGNTSLRYPGRPPARAPTATWREGLWPAADGIHWHDTSLLLGPRRSGSPSFTDER